MPSPRPLCLLLALTLSLGASVAGAQSGSEGDLQTRMSAQEFAAAGLNKLSPQELATLNAWWRGTLAKDTATVRESARQQGRQERDHERRGLLEPASREPIESTLVGEFRGFADGRVYVLANGQHWQQTESATLSGVRLSAPTVKIRPGIAGVWYLQVGRYNAQAKVRRIK